VLLVDLDDLLGLALGDDVALLDQHRPVAELGDPVHVMGHEDDRLRASRQLQHPGPALLAEDLVAGGEDLVEEEDVGVDGRRDREPETGPHPGRVGLDRRVDELTDVGEVDDRILAADHLVVGDPHERAGQHDVVAAVEVLVEAGAELEEAGDVAADVDRSQGALARAVRPDHGQ